MPTNGSNGTSASYNPNGRLANKVAIVTGSSSGLGRAIATLYAREGAKIVCSDIQPKAKVDIKDEAHVATHELIVKNGGKSIFVKADVGEPKDMEALVEEAVKEFGRVDIIVNNAGIAAETSSGGGKPIHETDIETFDKTMRVNVRGVWLGCKYAIAQMMKQDLHPSGDRGWVINLASVLASTGMAGVSSYCTSKGAVLNLTRQVGVEYGQHKIHCNALQPGFIDTAMIQGVKASDEYASQVVKLHPWGTFGQPEHIAKAALFLASEDAAFVTGVGLPVDGGYLAQ